MASERRARSDMEHEALLRLEAQEKISWAERAEEKAREARESAELEAESFRTKVFLFVCGFYCSAMLRVLVKGR